ncbi:hypothetical protein DET64_10152 [Marinobacter nauticus]|uniref:Uncharacterized protein n=2 Tax=Marinobacter nauticus TaxID=2743 RepID=A0A368V9B0_MARNT|nr:hypothetical protein DET64_10152 [Marinobacter nauticus]RCW37716.1 hypothetical protein DET51_10152 [Marinobacter nauticus]
MVLPMNRSVIFTIIGTMVSAIVFWNALAEAVVLYEMWATGASTRAELADDMGLGILLLVVVPPGTIILSSIMALRIWRHLKKRQL